MRFLKNNLTQQVVPADFLAEASQKFDMAPKIMEQIILRGNDTIEKIEHFLSPSTASFLNPFDLMGMPELVKRLEKAKETNETVLIFGDYDVDGISATAIMLKSLKLYGISARYFLPNRYVDGYGLTIDVLKKIKRLYNPSLIVTVDCGISCHAEVEFAKSIGIEIIVTDHHEIPDKLPQTVVINAKLPNQKYTFNGLCGTGVAYKIASALLGNAAEVFMPIAALATIADIVPLVDENRALVHFGLKKLDLLPIGLKMLFKTLGVKIGNCTATDISFKVAPKLNASGRMGDAQDSLKLYLSEDVAECQALIAKILKHNDNRKDLCAVVENDCMNILNKVNLTAPSIILCSKDWDHGILGIICSKLVGEFHRPVFLFSEHNGEMKGSARSIPGVNIHKLLCNMHEILEVFGGHPVAAGLTIKSENFDEFVSRVNAYLIENYPPEVFVPSFSYDIEVTSSELDQKFLRDLQRLEPCGCENETPKLFLNATKFDFTPMRNFYNHCNIVVDGKVNLVHFDALKNYAKMKYATQIGIIFELQVGFRSTPRGVVKAIDCDLEHIENIGKMDIIPYLEQIKFYPQATKPRYTVFSDLKTLPITDHFGTAIVINSEASFSTFVKNFPMDNIIKTDICSGTENSGLNTLFLFPQSIEFAKFYKKIIFLDPVIDLSYITKINQVSSAQVFLPADKPFFKYFETINSSRENFGAIYRDLAKTKAKFSSILELYTKVRGKKETLYNFKDFYAALCVFEELKLVSINRAKCPYDIKIHTNLKTELGKSKYYQRLQGGAV